MDSRAIDELIADETIPFCFDTNAIYGEREGPYFLEHIRDRFPTRRLLIPIWVVAERCRQLKVKRKDKFKRSLIESFLANPDLKVEVLAFDQETALSSWLDVVGRFSDKEWDWKGQPPEKPRPCAERCRTGDHIVHALALTHGALLVTDDKGLLKQVVADRAYLGAIDVNQLKTLLGLYAPTRI